MKTISLPAFKEVLEKEKDNASVDFINVCTPAEHNEKHIPGVRNVPLDDLEKHAEELASKKTIYVHCRSGRRSQKAIEKLQLLGVNAELINVEGGQRAWEEAGFAMEGAPARLPIMQQVFLAAGVLILVGYFGAVWIHEALQLLILLVGVGFLISGATGWCGMATLLAKMPWNKN